jgi:hypothetical protein
MPIRGDRARSSSAPAAGYPATGTAPGQARGRAHHDRFGVTDRRDRWWLQPLVQAIALGGLGAYATWAAFQGVHYQFTEGGRDYLSPFYSPLLRPKWWPLSPALLVLGAPLGFRGTCYYYRKAYYRAFFADPAACAVGELRSSGYCGEARFPFVLQNIHRYLIYLAVPILGFLWWDVFRAFSVDGGFAIGGGSIAILASNALLTCYTFSCHSIRHVLGGRMDCFSCVAGGETRRRLWTGASWLNGHHMAWAWWSLFAVCFADFYVRMCSMGVIHDPLLTFGRAVATAARIAP